MSGNAPTEERVETPVEEATAVEVPHALLFELEGFAAAGRKAAFEVLKSILGEQKLKFDAVLFSRFCLHHTPALYMEDLMEALGASKQSVDKLVEDVKSGIQMHLTSKGKSLAPEVGRLLEAAHKQRVPLAVISALPAGTADTVAENLGLSKYDVKMFAFEEHEDPFPRADRWLKVARSLDRAPSHCGVLAGSQTAVKSALSAGMHCVAIPDEFTSFQDFSGANLILEDASEIDVQGIMDSLCPLLGS